MSRIHLTLALAGAAWAAPLPAQDTGPDPVDEAFEAARETYGPPPPSPPQPDCKQPEGNEIVVCARLEEQSQFRIRSDEDAEDEYAAATMNKGNPQAPDVAGPGIFRGPASVSGLCLIPPCPAPPAYMVDFEELPEAPPGSDAERAARGLAPRGYDGEFTPESTEPEVGDGATETPD
ncbi:hypothetical protein V5F89_02480 [Pelagerythrobacter marensis]|uniref:Uncharacterized protein n=1 Tax=Pelagerythrobacter marensis TaxID=543877 RepID=A0ABZ2D462_9SPHN